MSMIPTLNTPNTRKNNYTILADGEYEARIVRFSGMGVQKQAPWTDPVTKEVKEKQPAFKADVVFELIGIDTSGTDHEGKALEARPACQFKSYPINPRAKRSGMLDLVRMIDPSVTELKGDLAWFREMLMGQPVTLIISHYTNKAGEVKNSIKGITPVPTKYRSGVGEARTDMVFFDPYSESDANVVSYNKLYPYQRTMLTEAIDTKNIPLAGREVTSAQATEMVQPTAVIETVNQEPQSTAEFDDEIPF